MSFEKIQTWLKNFNKFKPPLDVDQATADMIRSLQTIKDIAKKRAADQKDQAGMQLGKLQTSLLELANFFELNMDQLLRDKLKLLDSGPSKPSITMQKGQ